MGAAFFKTTLKHLVPLDDSSIKWLGELEENAKEKAFSHLAEFIKQGGAHVNFLGAVFTLSPFLRQVFILNPIFLDALLFKSLHERLAEIIEYISASDTVESIDQIGLMKILRRTKCEAHVLIALGDLGGIFTSVETSKWLTILGSSTLRAATRFLLRDAHDNQKISLKNRDDPELDCGFTILAMGKLGACELNYSSDIDLIALIDEKSFHIGDPYKSVDIFSKIMRRLILIMQERTADGYVFRVDLRLRPDPGSTPLALPIETALHYYESRGQNWERAAMIKARPIAGDIKAGEIFLKELSPYIWRKYLDYAAINDIHSIKRQIHSHKGHGVIAVRGHNVKLGRGGIREIEFFVQTQQLIAGGRFPQLRGRKTLEMLATLCDFGWINEDARDDLSNIYIFLRNIEHRIQMISDEQTHILPEDDDGFLSVARMMGYEDGTSFSKDFLTALKIVENHYAALFEKEKDLGADAGNLVFTGEDDDPETLATLSRLGFMRPSDIARVIRIWHFGRYRAMQSAEARERLTELIPALLKAFGATRRADDALLRFDAFLQGLPSGIQLFSLLQSKPALLDMLVLIMSAAPRLADIITRKAHVFDGILDPIIFNELPTGQYLKTRLNIFLEGEVIFENILDALRIFANEQRFIIGIQLLTGAINGAHAARGFTDLANLMLSKTLEYVEQEFIVQYGHILGGRIGILGLGKLGSYELTAGSDLDLILLYDHPENSEMSDGKKPLHVAQYYMRLTQRLVSALAAPTGEGVLYDVDLRLRPSGNMGPVAAQFAAFCKYQHTQAWAWEHMALTRARGIAGNALFLEELENAVRSIIMQKRDTKKIAQEVRNMRKLIEDEKPARNLWDFKTLPGGIIDLEFLAQFALLTHEVKFEIGNTTAEVLARLDRKIISTSEASCLYAADRLYTDLSQTLHLCLNEELNPDHMPIGLIDLLQRAVGEPDLEHVESLIADTALNVRSIFNRMVK